MEDLLFGWTLSVTRSEFSKHPFSSGSGYPIPIRGEVGVGSVAKLRQYQYHVCSFIRLFYPGPCCITLTDRIHARELHVLEMDLMLSSALSSLEAKAWPSENPQDNCDWREQLSLLSITILFSCLWNHSLKISFSVFSPWSEQKCRICSATGQIIPSETSLICSWRCWR